MPQEVARELAATAKALTAPGKGLLAADESTGKEIMSFSFLLFK